MTPVQNVIQDCTCNLGHWAFPVQEMTHDTDEFMCLVCASFKMETAIAGKIIIEVGSFL